MEAVRTASVGPDLAARDPAGAAPIALAADAERTLPGQPSAPARRLRNGVPIAAASVAAHLLLVALVLVLSGSPKAPAQFQETSVELVQDAPAATKAGAAAQKAGDAQAEAAPSPPVPSAAVPPPPSPQAAKPEAHEAAAPAEPASKAPQAIDPPKPQQAPSPTQPPSAASAQAAAKLQALQQELAELQTQKADLQAQADAERQAAAQAETEARADAQARARAAAADQTKALGLLPESFSAAALPLPSATGEDPITYEQTVYTIVNKARRLDHSYMPGVAHVVFDIDARGGLARVVIDHSSGNAATDEEALSLIRRAAPFPPPPDGAPRSFPAYMSFVADH